MCPLGLVTVCSSDGGLVVRRRPTFNTDEGDLRVSLVGEERFGSVASCWAAAEEVAGGGLETSVLAENHVLPFKDGDPSFEF